ncbi:glycosyltransferase family 4 protein [Oceanobacter kriegii]|uniref:glycosyltransferase family 4 protein n=1 Tax=Oceanobacter kriegii TaxID=64972 RepID=UPI0004163A31|nr:glycosyltransferase family 4 protein [Oceanobacter kriegii]
MKLKFWRVSIFLDGLASVKVLIVANLYPTEQKPHFGTFVRSCYEGYLDQGIDVDLAVLKKGGAIGYLAFYWAAFSKLLFGRYDYVHVHYVSHSVAPVLMARIFKKVKVLLNFHGSDAFPEAFESKRRASLKRWINQKALDNSWLTIVPSEYFKRKMMSAYSLKDVFVSPSGGVDPKKFKYNFVHRKSVLFAGRMIPEKGAVVAANAVRENQKLIEEACFIGDGPDLSDVKKLLSEVSVEFKGLLPHSELADQMSRHQIFLFPSTREGESLGLVVVEAIFAGMIPLVIDNGAVREIIPERLTALLVVSSSAELAESLTNLLHLSDMALLDISSELIRFAEVKYGSLEVSRALCARLV